MQGQWFYFFLFLFIMLGFPFSHLTNKYRALHISILQIHVHNLEHDVSQADSKSEQGIVQQERPTHQVSSADSTCKAG